MKNFLEHDCGCHLTREGNRWYIDSFCSKHQPNYKKKADKLLRRRNKKRGRGYTK